MIGPMRGILVAAACLVFLAGLQLTVFPLRTADWFAWTIDVPMTAVFLGAAYWSSAVLEVAGARSRDWGRARLTVWAVLAFTTLTLVVTLVHLDKFHLGEDQPTSAQLVTWGWLAIYAGVPVAMLVAIMLQTRSRVPAQPSSRRPLPTGLRLLLTVLGAVLLVSGTALLVVPASVSGAWSWPLTDLTARAIGAWLVGLGWAAAHARLIDDVACVRPLGLTGVAFVLLEAVALVRYGDTLDRTSAQAVAYLALLACIGAAAVWILVLGRSAAVRAADAGERARTR
jgi:hypothetical protein